jgi:hypothetical protein
MTVTMLRLRPHKALDVIQGYLTDLAGDYRAGAALAVDLSDNGERAAISVLGS